MKQFTFLLLAILLVGAACTGTTGPAAETGAAEATMVAEDAGKMADESMADESMADDASMAEAPVDDEMTESPHDTTSENMDGEIAEEPMVDASMASDTSGMDAMSDMDDTATMAELAAWQTLPLTNARTGETFTLGDFAGKTVFVEPMATWCSNCRQQLTNVQQARAQVNADDVVFVALSVETAISSEELAQYADNQGFDWTFAVMTPELLQALADGFGRSAINPPATPHFVIRADGSVSDLLTGIQSAEEIAALTTN